MSYDQYRITPDMQDWSDPKYLTLVKSHNFMLNQLKEIDKHFSEMVLKFNNLKADFEKYKNEQRNRAY